MSINKDKTLSSFRLCISPDQHYRIAVVPILALSRGTVQRYHPSFPEEERLWGISPSASQHIYKYSQIINIWGRLRAAHGKGTHSTCRGLVWPPIAAQTALGVLVGLCIWPPGILAVSATNPVFFEQCPLLRLLIQKFPLNQKIPRATEMKRTEEV